MGGLALCFNSMSGTAVLKGQTFSVRPCFFCAFRLHGTPMSDLHSVKFVKLKAKFRFTQASIAVCHQLDLTIKLSAVDVFTSRMFLCSSCLPVSIVRHRSSSCENRFAGDCGTTHMNTAMFDVSPCFVHVGGRSLRWHSSRLSPAPATCHILVYFM